MPIPADLLALLKAYKHDNPNVRFITGTAGDKPKVTFADSQAACEVCGAALQSLPVMC